MEINIRRLDRRYLAVTVEAENTKIDLGILNKEESYELAKKLESAMDDLNSGWDE